MPANVEELERRIDVARSSAVAISEQIGGVQFTSMGDVMEFAKMMAVAKGAVPPHLRGEPGACLAVCVQALEWRMSPFAVANKSYFVNDRIAYESQLIHAIVEARAPLKGRLRHEIIGEGDQRRCKVWGTFKGEDTPHEVTSEVLAKARLKIGGQPKGSPLWTAKPELALFYDTTRDWARMYCPDVILGIYAEEELPNEPRDVTPTPPAEQATQANALVERLQNNRRRTVRGGAKGFDAKNVEDQIADVAKSAKATVIEGETAEQAAAREQIEKAREQGKADGAANINRPIEDMPDTWGSDELSAYREAFNEAHAQPQE
jgi:hypothetical protein